VPGRKVIAQGSSNVAIGRTANGRAADAGWAAASLPFEALQAARRRRGARLRIGGSTGEMAEVSKFQLPISEKVRRLKLRIDFSPSANLRIDSTPPLIET
jgi:hypothetical protein